MQLSKLILTIFLTTFFRYESQALKVGDNIYTEFQKLKSTKQIESPAMSSWLEENHLLLIWTDNDTSTNSSYYISTEDKKIFGAYFKQRGSSYYLLDINADSILETKTTTFYMPYQFIKSKSNISSTDTSVLKMFSHFFFASLQSDNNITLDTVIVNYLKRFDSEITLPNRHLVYLFIHYQALVTNATMENMRIPTEICIPIIKSLADECLSIFKIIPPLVRIYTVEALLNDSNLTDQAKQEVKLSLKAYPDCIPLQVYDHNLEQDSVMKKQKLTALKRDHPNHWMVKRL